MAPLPRRPVIRARSEMWRSVWRIRRPQRYSVRIGGSGEVSVSLRGRKLIQVEVAIAVGEGRLFKG
jgi:hypothetical protein